VIPRAHAFTLVEMLSVMVLVAILSGFALGLIRGAHERAAIARAGAELAVLAQAIDTWREQYGGYPSVADPGALYESLTGGRGPRGNVLNQPGRSFIDVAPFSLRFADAAAPGNVFLDPWGQPYNFVSYVRTVNGCSTAGFVVFSNGPDGRGKAEDPPASGAGAGEPDLTAPDNADNLYSNR
jgi:prepilin-type N-terminal cleavage/methylation domain-containing protein